MNIAMRRGACPALSAPMQTGDGLLVRLNLAEGGIPPVTLVALCALAERHGNGIVEVTARGSFQIRGLTSASAPLLEAEVEALGLLLREGVPVETSPLAGLDPDEIDDPLPLLRAIRAALEQAGLSLRLGPKVSVVVDGGGNVDLSDILADVRLTATREDGAVRWLLAIGGDAKTARPVATLDEDDAAAATLDLLEVIAALGISARGKDLATPPSPRVAWSPPPVKGGRSGAAAVPELGSCPAKRGRGTAEGSGGGVLEQIRSPGPIPLTDGRFAASIALPFGSIHARELTAFLNSMQADEIRLAPRRSLVLICGTEETARAARETARAQDLVVDADDPRRRIAACPGAPACTSGKMATREIARRFASASRFSGSVHVSGCAKGCAHPTPADFVLVGADTGIALIRGGGASDTPFATFSSAEDALAALLENPT